MAQRFADIPSAAPDRAQWSTHGNPLCHNRFSRFHGAPVALLELDGWTLVSVVISRDRLDRELARRGWNSADLARNSGLSAATVATARQERPISARTLGAIARALAGAPPIDDVDSLLL
jgi:DNA-binding Xre family transcriptional regulator